MTLPEKPKFSDFYQQSEAQRMVSFFLLEVVLSRSPMLRSNLFEQAFRFL